MGLDPKNLNIVLLVDKSSSMADPLKKGNPSGPSRWGYAAELVKGMAREFAKYDDDGIDVVMFAGSPTAYEGVTEEKAVALFNDVRPGGGTDTAAAFDLAFKKHFDRKAKGETKSTMIVCPTDGEPNDLAALQRSIAAATKRIANADELAICFLQVGDDPAARRVLDDLDKGVPGAKYDVVKSMNVDDVEKYPTTDALIGAILEH